MLNPAACPHRAADTYGVQLIWTHNYGSFTSESCFPQASHRLSDSTVYYIITFPDLSRDLLFLLCPFFSIFDFLLFSLFIINITAAAALWASNLIAAMWWGCNGWCCCGAFFFWRVELVLSAGFTRCYMAPFRDIKWRFKEVVLQDLSALRLVSGWMWNLLPDADWWLTGALSGQAALYNTVVLLSVL